MKTIVTIPAGTVEYIREEFDRLRENYNRLQLELAATEDEAFDLEIEIEELLNTLP